MKLRVSSVLLCVLYVAVACGFGLVHDHHDGDAHQHCAACAWAVNAVADVPVPVVTVLTEVVTDSPVTPELVVIIAPLFCTTASRAPPVASA